MCNNNKQKGGNKMIKPKKTKFKTTTYQLNKETYLDITETEDLLLSFIWDKKGEKKHIISCKKGTITKEDFTLLTFETVIKNNQNKYY